MKRVNLVADPYPPYQFEEVGIVRGIDHDIIFEAFKTHHIKTETRLLSWEECMRQMDNKKADGIFQITRTPEREKKFLFSDILRSAKAVFFKREGNPIEYDQDIDIVQQLKGLKIGILSTNVTVTTSATALPTTALSGRRAVALYNNSASTTTVYIGNSSVTATNGFPLTSSCPAITIDASDDITVYGIVSAGTADLRVLEIR